MSRIVFERDAQQYRVGLPRLRKLPPNPHIYDAPTAKDAALVRANAPRSESAQTDPEPTSLKRVRHFLLVHDQRFFLTGSAVPDLQAAHIISPVRKNLGRKQRVVMEASLHVHWDTYGTFCFVPAEANVVTMLKALRQSNQDWEDVTAEPYNKPMWHVVVLHPYAMLPECQPLPIAQNRTFHRQGQPRPLPPFPASDIRDSLLNPAISSLAMVINAHSKLEVFMRDHGAAAAPRIQRYAQLMSDLVTEIFFVPEGMGSVAVRESSLRVSVPNSSKAGVVPGHTNRTTGQSPGAGHEHGGTNPHGRKQETPGPADTDSADAPEPPAEDGLTDTELRLVEAQALLPRNARMRR
ncbi:hypothetical protein OE88DRAFT_1715335 [Heliocybe sulcata]|uniref:Uncharacterized protein n=1 Tax=Heliocybe sulcata TaxID=5364 RepID=A0A5C3MLF4_9AGAM|nr:hypothetical protein OE88DRAFT_1715335 [Heliocybe sulcata]